MEKYNQMKKRHETELNAFSGIFFAFSDKQFKEGMEKVDLTAGDTKKIWSLGGGGFILRDRAKEFNGLFEKRSKELSGALRDEAFLLDALTYELCNHEFCITYDYEQTFDALGITLEDIEKLPFGTEVLKKARTRALGEC